MRGDRGAAAPTARRVGADLATVQYLEQYPENSGAVALDVLVEEWAGELHADIENERRAEQRAEADDWNSE